jgi:hypothetical protein
MGEDFRRFYSFGLLFGAALFALLPFQNCAPSGFGETVGAPSPSLTDHYSSILSPLAADSLRSSPAFKDFRPGPLSNSKVNCRLESYQQSSNLLSEIRNRVLSTVQSTSARLIIAWDGEHMTKHEVSLESDGSFVLPRASFQRQLIFYVELFGASGEVLCATPTAVVNNTPIRCELFINKTQFAPNEVVQFYIRHNLSPVAASQVTLTWLSEWNSQVVENGTQASGLSSNPASSFPMSQGPGFYRRQFILKLQQQEVCRSPWISFQKLTQQEAEKTWVDDKRQGGSSSGSTGGSGGTGSGGLDTRSEEERNYCQVAQGTAQCWVTRTYCAGQAPYQSEVTEDSPRQEMVTYRLPRGQRAQTLQNRLEFTDSRISIQSLRVLFLCNPDANPQWQFLPDAGFQCYLRRDERPPQGCDSSGYSNL